MRRTVLYHGGPLESENFDGATFWVTRDHIDRALEYADDGELWAMIICEDKEIFVSEDERALLEADSNEAAWNEQTRQIDAAFARGTTIFMSDDGWALRHQGRHVKRIHL